MMAGTGGQGSVTGIQPGQIKKLHALKNALKLTEDAYREKIQEVHGFSGTCKDLSFDEAEQIIKEWESEAIEKGVWKKPGTGQYNKTKFEDLGKRSGFATPKQLRMIESIWLRVSHHKFNMQAREDALEIFIKRVAKVDELRFLTKYGASDVINALLKMQDAKKAGHK